MAMGDRILGVNRGIVEQNASPETLYSDPANAYVAGAIGSPPMNKLRGRSRNGVLSLEGVTIPLFNGAPEGDIIAGIRPEDLNPVGPAADPGGTFEAKVQLIELLGARAIVTLVAGQQRLTSVFNRRELAGINEFDTIRDRATPARLLLDRKSTRLNYSHT